MAEPKLDNAGPPPKSSFGAPKKFFSDGDAKERAPKGRCQARRVWGHAPPRKFSGISPHFGGFLCDLNL